MNKELTLLTGLKSLTDGMSDHKEMVTKIQASMPAIQASTDLFYKSQSQFMDNMLTVSGPTPIRNVRQILAEMQKTHEAIRELQFKTMRKDVELRMKQREYETETDELKKQLIEVDMIEMKYSAELSKSYLSGAIRKLTNYTDQYNSLVEKHNLKEFTEEDFEREEEKYHIMTAFTQGICAARAHGGVIDEGNMIYLTQIGINGTHAQKLVSDYLNYEMKLIADNKAPTHKFFLNFLEQVAEIFKGCSTQYAEHKGMAGTMTKTALLTGDK